MDLVHMNQMNEKNQQTFYKNLDEHLYEHINTSHSCQHPPSSECYAFSLFIALQKIFITLEVIYILLPSTSNLRCSLGFYVMDQQKIADKNEVERKWCMDHGGGGGGRQKRIMRDIILLFY